ncbi:MAG: hypothetical protein ACRDSR_18520 [Pseudonocardiaceae bacterium]
MRDLSLRYRLELSDPVRSIRVVTVRQVIPEGLAEMALGPGLGVLLAGRDEVVVVCRGHAPKLARR